jgi:DNA-binding NtrC family response regulator
MPVKKRLDSEQRDFFSLVNRAAFSNHFSDERTRLDSAISGLHESRSREDRIRGVMENVATKIDLLDADGLAKLENYTGKDAKILEYSFLFHVYHQYIPQFDRLIERQFSNEEGSGKVLFSEGFLSELRQRGFPPEKARRYFEICYQIRRAFFFIDKNIVGRSPCMKSLRKDLWNNVFTHDISMYEKFLWDRMEDFSTLVLGETGTGKGTAAAAIGRSGFIPFDEKKQCFQENFTDTFLPINLSQYSESLIESELFGHKKGAFTGATEDHRGAFDICSPFGAILLDEIGEISVPIQIKLLQVLQDRVYCSVGSHQKKRFRGRVIAATNRPVDDIRERGAFRDDFYYRLCSDVIRVPPLRTRIQEDPKELDDLVAHTVMRMVGTPSPDLVKMVLDAIKKDLGRAYPWPGNVRELEQCARRVLIKRKYEGSLRQPRPDLDEQLKAGVSGGNLDAQALIQGYCQLLHRRHGTYEAVARITGLDRRTVKKHVDSEAQRHKGTKLKA